MRRNLAAEFHAVPQTQQSIKRQQWIELRLRAIVDLRGLGYSFADIATIVDVTGERARQIAQHNRRLLPVPEFPVA